MTRHLATFTLGALCGVLLALLLTQSVTSRQSSAPRPAQADIRRVEVPARTVAPTLRPTTAPATAVPDAAPTSATIVKRDASPEAQPSAKPTAAPTPKPTKRPRATTRPADGLRGVASWMPESYGARYLALPQGPGHRVRICGAGDCMVMTSNDAGPSKGMQRKGRIADIGVLAWERICGVPRSAGLCRVRVEAVQ